MTLFFVAYSLVAAYRLGQYQRHDVLTGGSEPWKNAAIALVWPATMAFQCWLYLEYRRVFGRWP